MLGSVTFITITLAASLLALVVYLVFHNIGFKNIFKKFKQYRRQRYGFYECGFRPKSEITAEYTTRMYLVAALALVYEAEGVYLLIILLDFSTGCVVDFSIILIYTLFLLFGFMFDQFERATDWQLY